VKTETNFTSDWHGGLTKNIRLHLLNLKAHSFRIIDDHTSLKVTLDSLYAELIAYMDEDDQPIKIKELYESSQKLLFNYLEWENTNSGGAQFKTEKQKKQWALEKELHEYHALLVGVMKAHRLDTPEREGSGSGAAEVNV